MILDKGICTIYHKVNAAGAGHMPVYQEQPFYQSWYAELDFGTREARPTDGREETWHDAKVRILQCRRVNNHDRVELMETGGGVTVYEVTRAYHGIDDDSGELITDLTLEVYKP